MHTVRLGGTVGDDVVVHHAVWRLNGAGRLARWNSKTLSDNLEVMDQRFHLGLHLFAIGEDDLGSVCDDPAFRHSVQRLQADLHRFAHLLHAKYVASPDVAVGRDRHLELELLVARVRHVAAKVEVDTGSAQRGGQRRARPIASSGEI